MASGSRGSFFRSPPAGRSVAGKSRVCPHCKATILDSASVCPACHRYLRYERAAEVRPVPELSPLRVSASIQHPEGGEPWEYSVVLTVSDAKGVEISRQVVGVGALHSMEQRTFNLTVEVSPGKSR